MFMKIYDFLFHRHKWVVRAEFPLYDMATDKHVGQSYILQCEKCGEIKYKTYRF